MKRHRRSYSLILLWVCFACSPTTESGNETAVGAGATPPEESAASSSAPDDLAQLCGGCHAVPSPQILSKDRWPPLIRYMNAVIDQYGLAVPMTPAEVERIVAYYVAESPAELERLEVPYTESPLRYVGQGFGNPPDTTASAPPFVANVNIVDLDRNGQPDVLICDVRANQVTWARIVERRWREEPLATVRAPAHSEVVDADGDGDLDIIVGALGSDTPTDDPVGEVVLLENIGGLAFEARALATGLPRVADVQPADLDGDGDVDFLVAAFGGWVTGQISWLERTADGDYSMHPLYPKNGAIHVPPIDLDEDGLIDFVAVVSQAHEEIVAFMNLGGGKFEPHLLFQAGNPLYGSSGIELVDLDGDGDRDILYTNGDAFDIDTGPKPYHGIQWLENLGGLEFRYHEITRLYGAYGAVGADLDLDGDLDIAATSLYNAWDEPDRQSLIWLENDGRQRFSVHPVSSSPTHLVTVAVGDLDLDGLPDILTGGMYLTPPFDRVGRVSVWLNRTESSGDRRPPG